MTEIEQLTVHIEVPRWQLERLGQYATTTPEELALAEAILVPMVQALAEAFTGRSHSFPTPMVRVTLTIEKPPRSAE